MTQIAAFLLIFLPGLGSAATPELGYVVKVDSGAIYLDLGANAGALVGQSFSVYIQGEELKHPVTGQSLGHLETTVAKGTLTEIAPLYSIGNLTQISSPVQSGMRARLEYQPAAGASVSMATATLSMKDEQAEKQPRWKSPIFDYAVQALAIADFQGDGKLEIALAHGNAIFLYPYPPQDTKPLAQYLLRGAGSRVLSLEAGNLDQSGHAALFASFYNDAFARTETVVLKLADGRWEVAQEIPWLVHGYQNPSGEKALAMQQLLEDSTFLFSSIYPLSFSDGKYQRGDAALNYQPVDWVYDFTTAKLDGQDAVLVLTDTGLLRAQIGKEKWESDDSFGQTPVRLHWQNRRLEVHPGMPVAYLQAKPAVYLVHNMSKFGSISDALGLFDRAEILKESWKDQGFSGGWKSKVGGYVTELNLVGDAHNPKDLVAAVVIASHKSSIWIYEP